MLLLNVFLVSLMGLSVQGYYWDYVSTPDEYDTNTVYYQSSTGTYGSCGYTDSAVGRFPSGSNRCYIPFEGEEFEVVLPYDVLVAEPYAEYMVWNYIYDAGTIADEAVLVCDNCIAGGGDMYVCASSEWGPGKLIVGTDSSVTCYVSYNGVENILTTDFQTLTYQGVYQYDLRDLTYFLDELDTLSDTPTTLFNTFVLNNDDNEQTIEVSLSYTKELSNEWSNTYGFAVGITMSVTAGIPLFGEAGWETSIEEYWETTYGQAMTESITTTTTASVTVPGDSTCEVSITARQMIIDVPYEATATIMYPDGTEFNEIITGVYEGLSVNSDTIVIGDCVPN